MKEKDTTKKQQKQQDQVTKFRDKNLSYKISVAVSLLLVICLTVMIAISATIAGKSLSNTVSGEFEGIATENGLKVQAVIDTAANTADTIQSYLLDKYADYEKNGYSGATEKSAIYDVELQEMNKQIETFLLSIASSTVKNNDQIDGVGVFFEPDAFDPAIKDYTVYVSTDDAAKGTAQSYGAYSSYGSQDYYKNAATSQKASFTDPYEDQGSKMFSASFPIVYNGKTQGVIFVDINIEKFSNLRTTDSKYPNMYVDIVNDQSMIIYDSESSDYIGTRLDSLISSKEYAKIQSGIDKGDRFSVSTKKDDGSSIVRYYTPIDAVGETWWATSALSKADLSKSTVQLVLIMILCTLITLIVIIIISTRLLRNYIHPLNDVVAVADKLAMGDFSVSVEAVYHDEIGKLADTFSQMAARLRLIVTDITRGLTEMASGNFNIAPEAENVGDFKAIETALTTVITDLSNTLREINETAETVAENSDQISEGAQALTEGATDQASSIEELQSIITNVSEQVQKNAEYANDANEKAKVVGTEITSSNDQMQKVVAAMETISESSQQISGIISTINDIASQTNLLALNASIEAARAGEAGKGFAVVATQVGTLAAQSAEAAKNSGELILEAMRAVDEGKSIVDETARTLLASVSKTDALVENIGEISAASDKQAQALDQISEAASQIAAVIQENTAMAEESSASSEELAAQAEKLKDLVGVFKLLEN